MNNTYILLSRSLLNSEVFASQKMLKIWIWCLCKANFKDNFVPLKIGRGIKTIKVKKGTFLFGRFKAEEELFIDGSTIYKILKQLEKMGNISIQSNNQYSIVTINNYNYYQSSENYKVASKEQPSNNQVTSKALDNNTTKKEKNVNKDKTVEETFELFWNKYHNITKLEKTDKVPAIKYWKKLNLEEQRKAYIMIENYFNSINDKKYIKKARTYLSDKDFDNEFEVKIKTKNPNIVKVDTIADGTKLVAGVIIDGLNNEEILKIWLNRDKEKYK